MRQELGTKNFTYTKKFYVHKIAAVDLSKHYFLKNANKTRKPNNRVLNRDWIKKWHKFNAVSSHGWYYLYVLFIIPRLYLK